ncbi:MAG: putative transcriptional modulator of MazE/toxin, MazF [Candidatus Nitrosotenuis sp.]|nr:putative transcriptional modulator of MazE/toxin, MazF [Candidatus Nitrosotenuis sp.]
MSKRYLVSQKDVVLIPFPFSDLSQAKFRPAIVMPNNNYNKKFHDFIAIPLTSNPNTRKHTVVITNKEMIAGSLPMDSVAKVDKVFSLEQKLIVRIFGQLRQDVFDNVSTELIKLIR